MLYSSAAPVGAVMEIVPVLVIQSGCTVTLAAGAAGGAGKLFTVTWKAADIQPVALFCAVKLYVPGAMPVKLIPL